MLKSIYILFTITISSFCYADESSFIDHWHKLLRYNKIKLQYISEVDDPNFFVHPKGKKNPKLELDSYIAQLENHSLLVDNNHPICKFPARATLLKKYNKIKAPLNFSRCLDFLNWKKKLNPKQISLIFASYYINQPSSVFGHTFIKVKSSDFDNPLLDYGINFAAAVDTNNPILYGLKGFLGGFKGQFTMLPYFLKVREYSDVDMRDLWEYELQMSEEQRDFFLLHLWEMNFAYFDYFYLSENCSYHVYRLLDAVNPEWNLIEKLHFYIIPIDTIFKINEVENLVSNIKHYPSPFKKLNYLFKELKPNEVKDISESYQNKDIEKIKNQSRLLDGLIQLVEFKHNIEILNPNSPSHSVVKNFRNEILIARSKLTSEGPLLNKTITETPPHLGHPSRRFSIVNEYDSLKTNNVVFDYRIALHHLTEPSLGYLPYSSIDFGRFRFGYDIDQKKPYLDKITVLDVKAINPSTILDSTFSWKMKIAIEDIPTTLKHEIASINHIGLGKTFLFKKLVIGPIINIGYQFDEIQNFLSAKPELFVLLPFSDNFKLEFQPGYQINFNENKDHYFRLDTNIHYSLSRTFATSFGAMAIKNYEKYHLDFHFYF